MPVKIETLSSDPTTRLRTNTLEFNLDDADHVLAFARLCNALNQVGTPYSTQHETSINQVALTISDGF